LLLGGNALYLQSRGGIIRDLGYSIEADGYRGNDMTIFSAHLFDGYTISDWAYSETPHSIVWVARSDGTLLGLTYIIEHQVWGWHRHDFQGGVVESVSTLPEGSPEEDFLYMVIRRTIDSKTVRYVERMSTRNFSDIKLATFTDSSLAYDGRNTNDSHTMTLSGGVNWDQGENITLTSSASYFTAAEVGNEIHMTSTDDVLVRLKITAYSSGTVVTVQADRAVPVSLQATATSSWSRAVDTIGGLWHLEGENISAVGDAHVAANPNNSSYVVKTVASGQITLDKCYAVLTAGLPYVSDFETLDIDTERSETLIGAKKLINKVHLYVESSRGIWAGADLPADNSLDGLREVKARSDEDYDDPPSLRTESLEIQIPGVWTKPGKVAVRQVDPAPLSLLAIAPSGIIPYRSETQ
jgi:hypothetical protein